MVYVETPREAPERIAPEVQKTLVANVEKARELGAEVVRLKAKDPVAALVDFARSHGVATILAGRSRRPWWRRLLRRSPVDRLFDEAVDFDLYVVAQEDDGDTPVSLRARILLAQAPLVAALGFAAWVVSRVASGRIERLTLATAALAIVLGVVASLRFTKRTLRPISVLRQAAERIGQSDFAARAQVAGSDELAGLARDFNAMAERLAELQRSSVGELLQARQAMQAAIDSLPDPVLIFDLDGRVRETNAAAEATLALRAGESYEQGVERADPEVRAAVERIRSHVLSGKGSYAPRGFAEALRLPSADGERFWLPRAVPLRGPDAAVIGATLVLQDVTRVRRIEELRDDLVATVAHELKSPLTSLRMAVHLCVEEAAGPLTATQADLLHTARQDCERIQSIIDDILDLARIQSGRMELRSEPLVAEELVAAVVEAHRPAALERGDRALGRRAAGRTGAHRRPRAARAGARQLRHERDPPHARRGPDHGPLRGRALGAPLRGGGHGRGHPARVPLARLRPLLPRARPHHEGLGPRPHDRARDRARARRRDRRRERARPRQPLLAHAAGRG